MREPRLSQQGSSRGLRQFQVQTAKAEEQHCGCLTLWEKLRTQEPTCRIPACFAQLHGKEGGSCQKGEKEPKKGHLPKKCVRV